MDERKIILMSKLAIEEKIDLKKDEKITSYYPEDYVYVSNFKTRVLIVLFMGVSAIAHIIFKIQSGMTFPTTGKEIFAYYILPYGGTIILAVILYTIISTTVYKRRYARAQKRINSYRKTLRELEEYEQIKSGEGKLDETKRKHLDF